MAAFHNPEFYKKQALRFSTALTPRMIDCAEDLPEHIGLPRGCLDSLAQLFTEHGVEMDIKDQRTTGTAVGLTFHGQLTDLQTQASNALLAHDIGILVAPPGTGKTVVGLKLIAERACNTLILVHRTQLLDQWRAQLSMFLGLQDQDIGQIGGGKHKKTGHIDVAMMQSLMRSKTVDELVAPYGHVIVDECHHVPAVSFERIMRCVRARYVAGLTATPHRRDGHHPILHFQLGPVRYAVGAKHQAATRGFAQRLILRDTDFRLSKNQKPSMPQLYAQLAADPSRNELILNDVIESIEAGRSPILLTERREHLEYFATHLRGFVRHLVVMRGGMGSKQRRELSDTLLEIPDDEERLILSTGRFIGEGFDDTRLDTLFLALPVSWKGTLIQYAGRLHRQRRDKTEVRIYDYADRGVPMLKTMLDRRLKGYKSMGYDVARRDSSEQPAGKHSIGYGKQTTLL